MTNQIPTNYKPLAILFGEDKVSYHVENKHLFVNEHEELDLFIYKYGKMCQYTQSWTDVTLSCRGLVLNSKGSVIGRGFRKFFNMEELSPSDQLVWNHKIKTDKVESYEKMDGSLGLFFLYNRQLICSTQGSFYSEQCVYTMENILTPDDKKVLTDYLSNEGIGRTVLMEIIYPANKIVVDYNGASKCVLLGSVDNATGKEFTFKETGKLSSFFGTPKENDLQDWEVLKSLNQPNAEGFVLTDFVGNKVKIKFEEYCLLHKQKSSITTKSIWESLMTFGYLPEDLLDEVPDEVFDEIKRIEKEFLDSFKFTKYVLTCLYDKIKDIESQKDFAIRVNGSELLNKRLTRGAMFALRSGKDIDGMIWDYMKPEFKKIF